MAFVRRGVYDNVFFLYDDVCTIAYGPSHGFDGVCLFNLSNAVPLMACPITFVQRRLSYKDYTTRCVQDGLYETVCTMAFVRCL